MFQVFGLDTAACPPGSTTGNVTTCPSLIVSTMVGGAFIKVINHMTVQGYSSFHISGLVRYWIQLAILTPSPRLYTSSVFDYGCGCLCQGYQSDGCIGMASFHISTLARDWTQLTLLPPPSYIRHSKSVSITVGDASVKVTNLMAAQDL